MKKFTLVIVSFMMISLLMFTGCKSEKQKQYERATREVEEAQRNIEELEREIEYAESIQDSLERAYGK